MERIDLEVGSIRACYLVDSLLQCKNRILFPYERVPTKVGF